MKQIIGICCQLSVVGFIVVLVCDGAKRHHTKRATIQRQSISYKQKVESYLLRVKIMSIMENKKAETNSEQKNQLEGDEMVVSSELKLLEKKIQYANVEVGQKFFESLQKHVANIPKADIGQKGGSISVIQAEYQADSVLAYRRVNQISDLVFSSDSDLLAHAGHMCLGIKVFNYIIHGKKAGIDGIELFTSDEEMLRNITSALRMQPDNKSIKRTRYAMFAGISLPKTRALIAIGLGCDVHQSGIRGVTKVVLKQWLDKHTEEYRDPEVLHNKLLHFFSERHSCDNIRTKKMLHSRVLSDDERKNLYKSWNILVESFMFEPCNFVPCELNNNNSLYIHNTVPTSLHMYCEDFAKENINITIYGNSNDVMTCCGLGHGIHKFLVYEGASTCFTCDITCCKYCLFEIKDSDTSELRMYCAKCFLEKKVIPSMAIHNHIPIDVMIKKLQKVSIELHRDDNIDVILALYDHFITNNEVIFDETILTSCKMPLEKAKYLDIECTLFKFNFSEGGRIIRNYNLRTDDKLALMSLFANLVTVKSNIKNRHHAAIPYFIVQCAQAARIRGGDRLLQRALRHAVDHDRTEIYHADAAIIQYKTSIGINITTKVRASMKNAHYNVCVSFCELGVIANTCTCKVGCYGSERIMCIHILPVIQQLALEIYLSLAEDLLYYFNLEWDPVMESGLSDLQIKTLKSNVISLVRASNKHEPEFFTSATTISDLLRKFDTGTDQRKKSPGPPNNKSLLGPLRQVNFVHPILSAKKIMYKAEDDNALGEDIFDDLPPKEDVPYIKILNMIKVIREYIPSAEDIIMDECVGYKVLALRASNSGSLFDVLDCSTKSRLLQLLDSGNQQYRNPRTRVRTAANQSQPDETDGEAVDNRSTNEEFSMENDEVECTAEVVDCSIKSSVTKRIPKCCVPMCLPCPDDTFFRRLPNCPIKSLQYSSDQERRTHAIKSFKRKEWLHRFGLSEQTCPPHVLYCNHHVLEDTEVEIKYKKTDGSDCTFTTYVHLPRDMTQPEVLTREDKRKRRQVTLVPPVPKKKIREDPPSSPSEKPTYADRWCVYVNCNKNSLCPDTVFTRVPPTPKSIPTITSNNVARFNHAKAVAYRAEFLRRIGAGTSEQRQHLRICNHHQVQRVSKTVNYELQNGTWNSKTVTFDVPSAYTVKSNLNQHTSNIVRNNRGIAYSRFQENYVNQSKECAERDENSDWGYCLWMAMEQMERSNSPKMNKKCTYGIVHDKRKDKKDTEKTIVQTQQFSNHILAKCTGFRSMASMLSFIVVVCNGDIDLMGKTISPLSWIEEWHLYFERVYGRSVTRMVDCSIKYHVSTPTLRKVFIAKLNTVLSARLRWPLFVTLPEDELLRRDKWESTYSGCRIIMWDNTDIPLATPSHPNLQRNTYSDYYNGNVGKGSVFIQLCGWLGTHEIWEGAVTDTDYFRRSGILQRQEQYVEKYDKENEDVNWINILDRGYKVTGECFANGRQKVLQPTFSHTNDPKFSELDTQLTAAVAADRGANERAVRLAKLSKYISDGYKQTVSVEQLCDVWLAWSFQVNFMYKPVL